MISDNEIKLSQKGREVTSASLIARGKILYEYYRSRPRSLEGCCPS